jgi:hypothetical protein
MTFLQKTLAAEARVQMLFVGTWAYLEIVSTTIISIMTRNIFTVISSKVLYFRRIRCCDDLVTNPSH